MQSAHGDNRAASVRGSICQIIFLAIHAQGDGNRALYCEALFLSFPVSQPIRRRAFPSTGPAEATKLAIPKREKSSPRRFSKLLSRLCGVSALVGFGRAWKSPYALNPHHNNNRVYDRSRPCAAAIAHPERFITATSEWPRATSFEG